MASNQEDNNRLVKSINKQLDSLQSTLDGIFTDTYSTKVNNNKEISRITDEINEKIDNILSQNTAIKGVPDIAQLYSRIQKKTSVSGETQQEIFQGLSELVNNKDLGSLISNNPEINRYIKIKDLQIDMVLKYMPKLAEALDIKKDNVLSSDNFSKEFIFARSDNNISEDKQVAFAQQDKELKEKYNIEELLEDIYDDTAIYGEYFLYRVPYNKAYERLINGNGNLKSTALIESGKIVNNGSIKESIDYNANKDFSVNININNSNILSEIVKAYETAKRVINKNKGKSLYEAFLNEAKTDKVFDDDLDIGELYNKANDGLTLNNEKRKKKISPIPGCITKKLRRDCIIPIYIEDICLGYYYLEPNTLTDDIDRQKALLSNTLDSQVKSELSKDNDVIVKAIAAKISNEIDANFINSNQDLKEEIYIMLKYNEKFNINSANNINVTFLPPEDVYHFYFKLDKDTHRGISDLDKSLLPATLWCLLELSTTIGIITRSQDKRIYKVKQQNVETNVARTMLNVINQLKKGNLGIRQMESMNNMLGILGQYNDHIVPIGPSGDSPIEFEVMQGQNIETPTDLLNKFEEQAINPTGVPLELVNSTDSLDYAVRFTMANSKFLRKVFKRQRIVERKFGEIYSSIYNYEYDDNQTIIISLPTPVFLTMMNGSQLLNNTKEYVTALAELEYPKSDDEEEKQEFIRLMIRDMLPTYIDIAKITEFKEKAKMEIIIQKDKAIDSADDDEM